MTQLLLLLALAQAPDQRGEVLLREPSYQGTTANAPIPAELHIENEGGSDGAGLCVIASLLCNGQYQAVPALIAGKASQLWQTAKSRPGGYAPRKLTNLLNETMLGEPWASYYGPDDGNLEAMSRQGYPIAATMNTGALYGYKPIAHMVSLLHYDRQGWACVVDNNQPGVYSWMPAQEFARRWKDNGEGWAVVWLRKPPVSLPRLSPAWLAALAALVAAALTRRRRVVAAA